MILLNERRTSDEEVEGHRQEEIVKDQTGFGDTSADGQRIERRTNVQNDDLFSLIFVSYQINTAKAVFSIISLFNHSVRLSSLKVDFSFSSSVTNLSKTRRATR